MNTQFEYLSSAELTDIGRRRKNNEDSMISLPGNGVFCVADGMGGVQGGEVASKAVVDALRKTFLESPDARYSVTAEASAILFERALNEASRWIKERADGLGINGTGSTAVGLVFDRVYPTRGIALHAGDSRAYRLRRDTLVQLTTDHSVAAAAGLPDDSTLPLMFRGVITRAVGLDRNVILEATPFDVAAGDIFLLCSDGLDKMLSDRRIHKIIRKHQADPLEQMAKLLIDEALHEGGDDNVTVIVIRVASPLPEGPTMETPPETLALQQLVVGTADKPEPAPGHEELDETGETANTAGTMATEGVTPDSPDSGRGRAQTPVTPAGVNPGIRRIPPASSGNMIWVWLLFALVALAGVGTFLVLRTNVFDHACARKEVPAARVPAPAVPEGDAARNEHPAAGAEGQGGNQE